MPADSVCASRTDCPTINARLRSWRGTSSESFGKMIARKFALVTVVDAQGQEGTPRMIHADERRLRDKNGALLAPIVGMSPPSHVGQETGRMPQSPLFRRFGGPGAREQRICPADQLSCMLAGPRPKARDLLASREQRILCALGVAQKPVEHAFADAESGEDHIGGLHLPDDRIQQKRAVGKRLVAAGGHASHAP